MVSHFRKRVVFVCLFVMQVLLLMSCADGPGRVPEAVRGVLDLTAADIESDGPVKLDGEWEFYWKRFINPGEFGRGEDTGYIRVPSIWNSFPAGGAAAGAEGYATYRLLIKTSAKGGEFGLKLLSFSSAYRIYANGLLIAQNGEPGTTVETTIGQHLPNAAFFPLPDTGGVKTIEIVCHVSNYKHPKGGFWHSAYFGTARQVQAMRERAVEKEMFFLGMFIIIGIYQVILFILLTKNSYTFYFGMICLVMALRVGLVGENLLVSFFPGMSWTLKVKMEMLTFYIITPLVTSYFYRFYSGYFSKMLNKVYIACGLLFSAVLVVTPYRFSYVLMHVNSFMILILGLYIFYVLFKSYKSFVVENSIFLVAAVFLLGVSIHDMLVINQVVYHNLHFLTGVAVFLLSQSLMISIQSARAFRTVEVLSSDLEQKVNRRTIELSEERNKLRDRNRIIEQDLAMARRIQLKLIPSESPHDAIAFHYKPMDIVGGDFFDFIQFRDSGKIGVFISDVSGHGVPAAFITSIIKTVILQSGSMRDDPAALLSHLNDVIVQHAGDNFVTAFYGIIDMKKMEMIFSNAGHNRPYLLYRDRIVQMNDISRMIPLGILDCSRLREEGRRNFVNESLSLEGCVKVLFYTDGLTEAIQCSSLRRRTESDAGCVTQPADDFASLGLEKSLESARYLAPDGFIEKIVADLTEFRGRDYFDDDICLVCVDIERFRADPAAGP